MKYIWLKEKN